MAPTSQQPEMRAPTDFAGLNTELEAAACNARNLLQVASRELTENLELGLSLVSAAERYVSDVIALNDRICAARSTLK